MCVCKIFKGSHQIFYVQIVFGYYFANNVGRDANFQDAEIVRSEKRHGLRPRERPSGVQEQRHFGGPGEYVTVSDVIDQIYRKYFKK